ncbi:MAG: M3 family metallopeptidase [Planctomycetota bacterium]|nr:M3 family metallopeptidase [Planctomycetota bacterium]MDG2143427.1 M3 family metallopeptidase [Planctomycetota bacterium]
MTTSTLPLLDWQNLPQFDTFTPDQVVPALRSALSDSERRLAELEANIQPNWESVDEEMTRIFAGLYTAWGVSYHLLSVHNSDELRTAIAEMQPEVVALGNRAAQSKIIYQATKKLADTPDSLDSAQQRILKKSIHGMELSGIALEGAELEAYNANDARLAALSMDFGNAVLDATRSFRLVLSDKDEVAGLPETALALAAQSAATNGSPDATPASGPWHITLDFPSYGPFMEYADRRDLREQVYRAMVTRASEDELDNTPRILEILELRAKQAVLLGYASHAEISLSKKMAKDVDEVRDLMTKVLDQAHDKGEAEVAEIKAFAASKGGPSADEFMNWDVSYWLGKLRIEQLDFDQEALRPYLPMPKVLEGMFELTTKLFGVSVVAADGQTSVWNTDVRFFNVLDEGGEHIASFYLDAYSRPQNKRGGAWVSGAIGRSRVLVPEGSDLRIPTPYVVCNFPGPVGEKPALLSLNDVTTLFHEFGHALQNMLTTVDYDSAAGTSGVEWDAVELPSQFMENWCYHKQTLLGFSGHWQTGEPLPDELFEKLTKARTFHSASGICRQIAFGQIDLTLHHDYDPKTDGTIFDVQRRVSEATLPMMPLLEDRFLCAFSHIFAGGYSAGYYSYLWAEVLSADAFGAFEEVGLDNDEGVRALGRKFRETVLALGGSQAPAEVFESFRGRPVEVEALLRHRGIA